MEENMTFMKIPESTNMPKFHGIPTYWKFTKVSYVLP